MADVGSTFSDNVLTYTVLTLGTSSSNGTVAVIGLVSPPPNAPTSIIISSEVTNENITYNVTQIGTGTYVFTIFENSGRGPVPIPNTTTTTINIQSSVTIIEANAFSYCCALTSLTIPESVTVIGDYAFYLCTALTNITIPSKVTKINTEIVTESGLKTITINGIISDFSYQGLAYIGNPGLESLTFGGDVVEGTSVPRGITQVTDGSYTDENLIFINSLAVAPNPNPNNIFTATIQVPGPSPTTGTAFPYSSAIVDAIQNDYQGVTFTINYNAVTTPNGVDYVEQVVS